MKILKKILFFFVSLKAFFSEKYIIINVDYIKKTKEFRTREITKNLDINEINVIFDEYSSLYNEMVENEIYKAATKYQNAALN